MGCLSTRRGGGCSTGPYASWNLGDHVGDAPTAVASNREHLRTRLPEDPVWLRQVHGTVVVDADALPNGIPEADAAVARRPGRVCAVLTADCLPVLLCDREGKVVGAAHAGWRGLLMGILELTVDAMAVPGQNLMAWLGPAIGPAAFEVGGEVRSAFIAEDPGATTGFAPGAAPGKWWADLPWLARRRLARCGVVTVFGGNRCTYSEAADFFSYRRDGVTGRMASLIWRN
ncbi:MAG: peptidoglycan editing factor PgeF [Zoogloeaceae bacterium]|nr:peptidoglycan editing factor PgeF [Zoogloeaceae bacterium]